jgi:hypothetical protein
MTPMVDASRACAAMQAATVQIRGDLLLFQGAATSRVPAFRAGSGFWIDGEHVVTAAHVVARMERIEVCDGSGADCRVVDGVSALPDADLAVLSVAGPGPAAFHVGVAGGPGQSVVAAGYPGDVGFVCGPGHLTSVETGRSWLFFDGTVAAEGSSGGPIALLAKSQKRLTAVAAVSGGTMVGTVQFDRGARLDPAVATALAAAPMSASAWRIAQPWAETRPADLELTPGRPLWEDVAVPGLRDVEIEATGDGVCVGLYHAPASPLASADPTPIGWTCDGGAIRFTTSAAETVRVGLWTDSASGWTGHAELRLR